MIQTGKGNTVSYHLAGIIPVAGMSANINLGLPNCMAMIAENYTVAGMQCCTTELTVLTSHYCFVDQSISFARY